MTQYTPVHKVYLSFLSIIVKVRNSKKREVQDNAGPDR